MSDDDTCPTCGQRVEEPAGETAPEEQRASCPACGTELRRALGEPWRVSTGPGSDVS
jgi:uncharacterized paraquat-inducible protein A